MSRQQLHIHIFQRRSLFLAKSYFNSILGPTAYLFIFRLELQFNFCVVVRYQSTTKVNQIKGIFRKIFLKKYFPKFLSLSVPWSISLAVSGANEFYKLLIFQTSALIIFFKFSIYNAVRQQVYQKYTTAFSKKFLFVPNWPLWG